MSDEDVLSQPDEVETKISQELRAVHSVIKEVLRRRREEPDAASDEWAAEVERRLGSLETTLADAMGGLWALVDWIREGE